MVLSTECNIAIIGAGPVGLFLANLLGLAGHRVALMERNALVRPDRLIAERLAPGRTPACLGLINTPVEIVPFATGEAA